MERAATAACAAIEHAPAAPANIRAADALAASADADADADDDALAASDDADADADADLAAGVGQSILLRKAVELEVALK